LLDCDQVERVAARGAHEHAAEPLTYPLADSLPFRAVLDSKLPLIFSGHLDDELFYSDACQGIGCSCINAPLRVQNQTIGLLTSNRHRKARYNTTDAQMLAAGLEPLNPPAASSPGASSSLLSTATGSNGCGRTCACCASTTG